MRRRWTEAQGHKRKTEHWEHGWAERRRENRQKQEGNKNKIHQNIEINKKKLNQDIFLLNN